VQGCDLYSLLKFDVVPAALSPADGAHLHLLVGNKQVIALLELLYPGTWCLKVLDRIQRTYVITTLL